MFYDPYFLVPRIPDINNNPPTLYSILNSIVNYGKEDKTKIEDLAKEARGEIFDFTYPLSEKVNKENFETLLLNRFLMRRIGFETFTAFKINLNVKLNMIMPKYNMLFDSVIDWNIFNDKEITERIGSDKTIENNTNESENSSVVNNTNSSNTENKSDRRFSELPQNQISEIENGNYMTQYNLDNNTSSDISESTESSSSSLQSNSSSDQNKTYNEKIEKTLTPNEKFNIYIEMQKNIENIYEMIFTELNDLFYSIIN